MALGIDRTIDIMEYPYPQLAQTAKARRSIGMGVTNLANYMARNGMSYMTQEGKNFIHEHMEMHSYYCHKASLRLAREYGNCEWIDKTKYPEGWLPIDTYNKNVDGIVTTELKYDWEGLRQEIIEQGGIRHSVLEATAPYESSSLSSGTTNSVYPIREWFVTKTSGTTKVVFAAPDIEIPEIRDAYEFAWDIPTKDHIDVYAITQKFHGQGVSADLYKRYSDYPNEKIPLSELLRDYYYATKMGVKALYYQNTSGGIIDKSNVVDDLNLSVVQEDNEQEDESGADCEACKM